MEGFGFSRCRKTSGLPAWKDKIWKEGLHSLSKKKTKPPSPQSSQRENSPYPLLRRLGWRLKTWASRAHIANVTAVVGAVMGLRVVPRISSWVILGRP
jgi:hypothetical protein